MEAEWMVRRRKRSNHAHWLFSVIQFLHLICFHVCLVYLSAVLFSNCHCHKSSSHGRTQSHQRLVLVLDPFHWETATEWPAMLVKNADSWGTLRYLLTVLGETLESAILTLPDDSRAHRVWVLWKIFRSVGEPHTYRGQGISEALLLQELPGLWKVEVSD